jgi:hemerythrin
MYIEWIPEYSVEVKEIDDQHKKFVLLLNDLADAVEIGCEEIALSDILAQLVGYAGYHFATEERYFDEFHYENADVHKIEHHKFREQVAEFQKNYVGREKDYATKIMEFMKDWIVVHIKTADKAYSECFKQHGLV